MQATTRRNAALVLVAGAATGALAACNGVADIGTITGYIKQVQGAVAKACSVAGTLVPEADAVLALLTALAGGNAATISAATVLAAVKSITAAACPAPTAAPRGPLDLPASVSVSGVNVTFIRF